MKAFLSLVMVAAMIVPVQASQSPISRMTGTGPTILVEEGCGRDYHRNGRGVCEPNWREMENRACPRGWHLGPEGRRCWPN